MSNRYYSSLILEGAHDDIVAGFHRMLDSLGAIREIPSEVYAEAAEIVKKAAVIVGHSLHDGKTTADTIVKSFSSFSNVIEAIGETDSATAMSVVRAALDMVEFGGEADLEQYDLGTYSRHVMAWNRNLVIGMFRGMGIITASWGAVSVKFDSATEAVALLREIVATLDYQLLKAGGSDPDVPGFILSSNLSGYFDDRYYTVLESIRPKVVQAMRDYGASFSPVILEKEFGIDPPCTLRLAYEMYEDIDRADEVAKRNATVYRHPGLPPGGSTAEVLSE